MATMMAFIAMQNRLHFQLVHHLNHLISSRAMLLVILRHDMKELENLAICRRNPQAEESVVNPISSVDTIRRRTDADDDATGTLDMHADTVRVRHN